MVSKLLSRATKVRVHKMVIRSILMYGCKTWTLTLKEKHKLTNGRTEGISILEPTKGELGNWKTRFNEFEELVFKLNIIGEIISAQFRWLAYGTKRRCYNCQKSAFEVTYWSSSSASKSFKISLEGVIKD